jgi:hypothetical protein
MTRAMAVTLWVSLSFTSWCASSDSPETRTEVREFAPNGVLWISLRAGDVRIVKGTDSQHIKLRYTPRSKDSDAAKRVQLSFDAHDSHAEIRFSGPLRVDIDAEIEVPSPTSLQVRIKAGDLTIEGIEGDKDLQLDVGDVHVGVEPKPDYWKVDASTYIGDVQGSVFGGEEGWLGKSVKFHGEGHYRLLAHVGIGDITFTSR